MIQFSACKINLGLSILEKRKDGFHSLETVFYPVHLNDIVEITIQNTSSVKKNINDDVKFSHSGLPIPGDSENNLCVKAYHVLKADFPQLPKVQIHLHKNIPIGAGLGGGSGDGSTVLNILNTLFNLKLSTSQLLAYALKLGSDCPFFIYNKACHASSRGEVLMPIDLNLSKYTIVLIHPGIHISTAWAFQQLTPCNKEKTISKIIQQPIESWKNELINDFELPVFKAHPLIEEIKNYLYQEGALYASMSGSGSSLFGIFPKGTKIKLPKFSKSLRCDII